MPLLKRVPAGAWTALAWGAATLYSIITFALPPEPSPFERVWRGWAPAQLSWPGLALATVLALAGSSLLHRQPLPALVLLLAGSAAAAVALDSTQINFLQFLAVDVALYFIAATRPRATSIATAALALGVLLGYALAHVPFAIPNGTTELLAVALTALVAWLVGNSMRQSRDYAQRLHAQVAAQAVTAERLRIARELHDMVAHSIGIIALQSGAASRVLDTQPARARSAMVAVETASRETLAGLRRMLGALRDAQPEPAPSGPASGLADVEQLAAATTAAGVRVEVKWLGERRPLPVDIDLSAYRIIQESVTNVVRHAGTGSCQVSIDHRDEELAIEILDSGHGRGANTAGTGFGLVGMRERVSLLHGDFSAEPRPEGGFRVTARLPLPVGR
ncbi:sensor histidine kinase [Streptacidiphilus sp. P02-A3a]|nr:sensor histidine kinase [Streptacidiphilus sp. P02-A3a]